MTIDFDPKDRTQVLAVYEMIFMLMKINNPELVVKWLVPKSEKDK